MPRTPRQEIMLNLEQSNNALDRAISENAKSLQIVLLQLQQSIDTGEAFPETYQRLGDALDAGIEMFKSCKEANQIIRTILDE